MKRSIGIAAIAIACHLQAVIATAQDRAIPLDTVTVAATSVASADMASATRGTQVITADIIRSLPVRSVPEVLQWAMGVDLMPRSPALVDIAIRGSSFEQVLILVDGVAVSDAQTGHFDLDLAVPLDQVERIEILRGAASTMHGSAAVGGVVNIVTRQAGASHVRIDGGSFGTAGMAVSHTLPVGAARLDLGSDVRRSDGHRPGTDYDIGQLRLGLSAPVSGRLLDADLAWAGRNFGAKGFYGSNPAWNEFEKTRATTLTVALRSPSDARWAIDPVVSYRRHSDDFVLRRDDPSFYQNQHTTDQLGAKVRARYALTPVVRLAAGGDAVLDRIESTSLGDRDEMRAALLAETVVGRVGTGTLALGARADWHETQGTFLSPSLSGAWWPVPTLRVRGSVSRALRTATWTERYYQDPANIGDPDLHSERSWSGEAGVDLSPLAGVQMGLAAFQRSANDLIDWARPAGSTDAWETRNVSTARFRGIEAELAVAEWLGFDWRLQGSWLSVTASTPDGVESKYALRPLAENVTLGVQRDLPGGVGVALRAMRARRVGEEAHLRADTRVTFDLPGFRLYADAQNVSDAGYLDITGVDAAGRSLQVGVEWRGGRPR